MSNADEQEWVSVADAAKRLQADRRAVRRVLDHPTNADKVQGRTRQQTRATRTGVRVSTVYPLDLVVTLWNNRPSAQYEAAPADLDGYSNEDEDEAQTVPEQGRDAPEPTQDEDNGAKQDGANGANEDTPPTDIFTLDAQMRAYLALLTQKMQTIIDDRGRTIDDLRGERDRLLLEVERLKALPPAPMDSQNTHRGRVERPHDGDSVTRNTLATPDPTGEDDTDPIISREIIAQTKRKPWWMFWKAAD